MTHSTHCPLESRGWCDGDYRAESKAGKCPHRLGDRSLLRWGLPIVYAGSQFSSPYRPSWEDPLHEHRGGRFLCRRLRDRIERVYDRDPWTTAQWHVGPRSGGLSQTVLGGGVWTDRMGHSLASDPRSVGSSLFDVCSQPPSMDGAMFVEHQLQLRTERCGKLPRRPRRLAGRIQSRGVDEESGQLREA